MSDRLKGKVALVTGASRGIGKGIALELVAAGATVYITARSIEERHPLDPKYGAQPGGTAQEVVEEAKTLGGLCIAIKCDHADDTQVREVIDQIERQSGRVDILVNNAMASEAAGIALGPEAGGRPFWQVPLDAWDMIMTVGLRSHFATTVMSMPLLIKSKGLVVNVSSVGGETYWSSIAYGVEKSGADRMIRDMAYETGPGSVTFLSIWPGVVITERNKQSTWREHLLVRYRVARELVARRIGKPVEVVSIDTMQMESQRFCGKAIVALASDPNINLQSGRVVSTSGVAEHYGYTDVDGTIPDGFSFRQPGIWKSLAG